MKKLGLFLLLCAAAAASAADPAPVPKGPPVAVKQVKFPDFPSVKPKVDPPVPAPKADPDAPAKLGKGQYYVVASPKPLLILPAGTGEVTVQTRKPPFMLPAAQALGWQPDAKDPEFVTWGDEYPYLYVVKGSKSGDVALTVIPALNDLDDKKAQIPLAPKDVLKKLLQVDDGTGPRPPPDVIPVPKPVDPPKPPDVIPNPSKGFRVLFIYERQADLTQEQLNILASTKIVAYLNDKCVKDANGKPEFRKWDKSTIEKEGGLAKESALWQQMWKDSKDKIGKLPQVVIVNDQAGVPYEWPATEDAMLALLKKYGG